jgi:uncharacterized integral membrane protein
MVSNRERGVYRLGFIIVTVLAVVLGLLIGTLNHEVVAVDLLWLQLSWPLGLALICALALGVLIGLALSWLFSVLPLRLQLRNARREQAGRTDIFAGPHG